jgi:hypothetical protein
MTTSPKPGLHPARGGDPKTVLGALELVARSDVVFMEVGRTEAGLRVPLEPRPRKFDRVEVGREYGGSLKTLNESGNDQFSKPPHTQKVGHPRRLEGPRCRNVTEVGEIAMPAEQRIDEAAR